MKSTDITFSQIAEKRYLSDAIQVNSETIGLQLEFKESGKLAVYISYDGEKYSVVETRNFTTLNFARPVVGLIPDNTSRLNVKRSQPRLNTLNPKNNGSDRIKSD